MSAGAHLQAGGAVESEPAPVEYAPAGPAPAAGVASAGYSAETAIPVAVGQSFEGMRRPSESDPVYYRVSLAKDQRLELVMQLRHMGEYCWLDLRMGDGSGNKLTKTRFSSSNTGWTNDKFGFIAPFAGDYTMALETSSCSGSTLSYKVTLR